MTTRSGGTGVSGWPMGFLFPFSPKEKKTRGEREGRTIAVCSVKGGVGKTTTSVNLAAALAASGEARVLLIDADPQGHASGCLSGIAEGASGGLAELLPRRGADISDAVLETDQPGLSLLPAGVGLQAAETSLASRIGRETVIKGLLDAPRTRYDYVVIDCPPSLSLLAVGSLVAADAVLIPCEPSPLAICGLGSLLEALQDVMDRLNPSLRLLGVVQTRVDGRNKRQNREAEAALQGTMGELVLPVSIGVSTDLARARTQGVPTVLASPRSRAAEQHLALAAHVRRQMEDGSN